MKMKIETPPEPQEIASWFVYLGGLSMCIGSALYKQDPAPFFWHAGQWTIGFAVAYYLIGWWRGNGRSNRY